MNPQQDAECDKLIRSGLMHGDTEKDRERGGGSGSAGRKRGWSQGEVARWRWRWRWRVGVVGVAWDDNNRGMEGGRGGGGFAERKGAGEEAMRRKSTAHQGEIEMMEGSQLRRRDRRMETQ